MRTKAVREWRGTYGRVWLCRVDRREALLRLGLDETAERAEVDAAYRALAKELHPDRTGQTELMVKLNEARAVAQSDSPSGMALVPLDAVAELVRAVTHEPAAQAESERVVRSVVQHQVGLLRHQRRVHTSRAVLSGGITAVIAVVGATAKLPVDYLAGLFIAPVMLTLGLVAAFNGLRIWQAKTAADDQQAEIEEVADTLGDKGTYVRAMREIAVEGKLQAQFTRDHLHQGVCAWAEPASELEESEPTLLQRLRRSARPLSAAPGPEPLRRVAARIGEVDFAALLIAKGAENGLLIEARFRDSDVTEFGYRLDDS